MGMLEPHGALEEMKVPVSLTVRKLPVEAKDVSMERIASGAREKRGEYVDAGFVVDGTFVTSSEEPYCLAGDGDSAVRKEGKAGLTFRIIVLS